MAIGDRHHHRLDGRQPERERARVVLDEHGHEALVGAEDGAVDHHRPMRLAVLADVLELEALRHLKIELGRVQLPRPTERVLDVDVDLGP